MRSYQWSRSLVAATAVGALVLSACGLNDDGSADQDYALPDGEIVLAGTAPMSGTMGMYGTPQAAAFQAAVDYVNEKLDGIAGRKIKLRMENDQSDPAVGVALAQSFVEDGVAAILFPSYAPMADQVLPIYRRAGMIVSTGTAPEGEFNDIEKYPRIFSHSPDADHYYNTIGPFLKKSGITKVGVISDNLPKSEGLAARTEKEFADSGVDVVSHQVVPYASTEFTTAVRQLRDAGAESLFLILDVGIAQVYDALRGLNWTPEVINAGNSTAWFDGLDAVGEFGSITYSDCSYALEAGTDLDPTIKEIMDYFVDKVGASFPAQIIGVMPALNAVLTYKYAVEEVDSLDPAKVAEAIEGFRDKEYLTPANVVSFSESEHVGMQTSATCSLLPLGPANVPYVARSTEEREPYRAP